MPSRPGNHDHLNGRDSAIDRREEAEQSGETNRSVSALGSNERTGLIRGEESTTRNVAGIISVLMLGVFVSNADGSLVLATYGMISSEFDKLEDSAWLVTSFLIASCATQALVRFFDPSTKYSMEN